ncbi:microtubule-actin cross-linking factor 1, isoforms 6/7-like isoform X2 [Pantherophis guttatus]|uniref:Microtubule-actin cross-linking factor 1, isoforms 6/7-like isoform X2 n=1 Tax=Pantherophis guttatus TaxID=94885 RepID=A0ABM3YPU7_PANGU|nr:microtubule-actin cross-linking factor 1, isoforms 6/7-like isoform X2 [Pantherophis guttatus]
MGSSISRPSCLGEKSPRPEDFLKEPCLAALNKEEDGAGSPEKACLSPRMVENGWNVALEGAAKSCPFPKQNNLDIKLRNCCPLRTQQEGAVAPWTSPESLGASWGWKLHSTREVTEVTEVTETVVTEIVEVTEYPDGDKSREASVTRMGKAAALPRGMQGAGLTLETAGKLGAWVSEVEDLMGHQKPPSGEAKVVKAQLQEQKLLLRLLEERTPHIGRLCHPLSAEPAGTAKGQEQPRGLASLQEKWAILMQEAEARHSCLQQIVPAADVFQESVEAFQDWLSLTEQKLAQLWGAPGSLTRSQDAHQQIQDLRREVQSKPAELEEALERGLRLLQMVPGEEGRLVQGKMDSLQLRLLLVDQRSSDTLQQMEQILEASSHLDLAQEDLGLGLQPPEKEQLLPGSQPGDGPCPLAPAGGEKLSKRLKLVAGSLEWLQDRTRHPLTLRGDPVWLQEQLWESSLWLAELEKLALALETLREQGAELQAILQSTTHPAIQERMQDLQNQWQLLWQLEKDREASLQELLVLARQFWPGLAKLAGALSNTQRIVLDLEDTAASSPKDIQAKLVAMQALHEEVDGLQSELDSLGAWGMELMSSCGDPEKLTVTQSLDDLYSSWNSLNRMCGERQKHLEDQLQASVTDQATTQRLLAWLAEAEQRVAQEFLGEGDPVQVEQELSELKAFKRELYQRQVEAERLWQQSSCWEAAQEDPPLTFGSSRDRWTQLEEELLIRQHRLEAALLRLGRFQSQLDWLLQGLLSTEEQLRNPLPLMPDLQSCEIELAKHQVLWKDVLSHTMTMQAVQEAGWHLPSDGSGPCAEALQGSLQQLSHRWSQVLAETEHRQLALEHNLNQELCKEMESKRQTYQQVQEKLQHLLATCHPNRASMAEHSLRVLEQKWGGFTSRLQEQKALAQETAAQSKKLAGMEAGTACLTQGIGGPRSLMGNAKERLAKVLQQVSERGEVLEEAHQQAKQEFQSRLRAKRRIFEATLQQGGLLCGKALLPADGQELDAMQRKLKERWRALWSWGAERQQKLEEHLLFSSCFGDALQSLLDWLCQAEPQLAEETPVAGDRDLVGMLMEQHKQAFQTELGRRTVAVRTLRCSARVLAQDGSSMDARWLQIQMEELEDRWELIGRLSVSQQNRLEVALRQA